MMSAVPPTSPASNPPLPRFPPPPPPRRSGGSTALGIFLGLSLAINFLCLGGICVSFFFASSLLGGLTSGVTERATLGQHHYGGDKTATDKIAIVQIDGVLMEGLTSYANKQIEQA